MRSHQGLLAILGLMVLATACGGGSSGSATHASGSTPLNPVDPPAFSGEPNYQKIPITGAQSVGLSDQDARDLLRWTVRFATYEWSFDNGQTRGQRYRKAYPFYTPREQALQGPRKSEADARRNTLTYQAGRQRITWPGLVKAQLDRTRDFPSDVEISVGLGHRTADASVLSHDIVVTLVAQKTDGHWRFDTMSGDSVGPGGSSELP